MKSGGLDMAMTINPNNMSSSQEVKKYSDFKKIKGYVDQTADKLKNIDNDDKVDLSPALGNVAVDNLPVINNIRGTGVFSFDPQTGTAKQLDMELKDRKEWMGQVATANTHLKYSDDGINQVYDFDKREHVHDNLSGLSDNGKFHVKYTVNKETGLIDFEELK